MKKMLGPTSALLLGAAFIFLILCMSSAAQQISAPDSLIAVEEYHHRFVNNEPVSSAGPAKSLGNNIRVAWALPPFGPNRPDFMPPSKPVSEKISLEGDCIDEQLQDMKAFNSVRNRDIVYDLMQNGSAETGGLSNELNVCLAGKGYGKENYNEKGFDDNNLEQFVDNKFDLGQGDRQNGNMYAWDHSGSNPGNFMNIDVSGITVSAVNTVEGGSAVATSNIIIKPVQLIIYPSEVEEKLR